jgi:nitronate monooxygenase
MNFGSGGNTDAKAWKDIWGSGQGIGSIKDSPSVQTLVDQLTEEFKEAVADLNQKSTY